MAFKDWSLCFPGSMQLQLQPLHNLHNQWQLRSTCSQLQFGAVAGLLCVWQPDFKTLSIYTLIIELGGLIISGPHLESKIKA